jgi:hypothetical protein
MPSELELEIQQHLMQYLSGDIVLADFENWFSPVLWEIDVEDEHTRELAGTIHLLISEFSRGDRTLENMRKGLAETICISAENRYGELGQRVGSFVTHVAA